jgi:adenylate kinase family enzyme
MITPPKKIMIFGRPGSGKSTFSLKLHKATGIPIHHLDKHFYEANWRERDYEQFIDIQSDIVRGDSWIIDGNQTKSLELRWYRADLVIYFNFPHGLCYWPVFQRLFVRNSEIDDRAEGCNETIRWSLLRYMWSFEDRVNGPIKKLKRCYPEVKFIEVNSDEDLMRLYDMLQK